MDFRENLKLQLTYRHLTVKELSVLSGVKKPTIDSYLNYHRRMPSAEAALRIAQVLDTTVEQLFGDLPAPQTGSALYGGKTEVADAVFIRARILAKEMRKCADMM
jgi:transcriptional regulator with XRE-family HTH domain